MSWASDSRSGWSTPGLPEQPEYNASSSTPLSDSWNSLTTPQATPSPPWTPDDLYRQPTVPHLPEPDFGTSAFDNIRGTEYDSDGSRTEVYDRD